MIFQSANTGHKRAILDNVMRGAKFKSMYKAGWKNMNQSENSDLFRIESWRNEKSL